MIVSEVIRGVPVPPAKQRGRALPFEQLDVGDAFDISMADTDASFAAFRARVASAVQRYAKRTGAKFVTRRMDGRTLRCWRVD